MSIDIHLSTKVPSQIRPVPRTRLVPLTPLRYVLALPTELVGAMFEMGVHAHPERRARPFEVLASHVAQRWRAAALGCPRLWTQAHSRRLAALHVRRSGALTLDVEIRLFALDWDEESFKFEREFGTIYDGASLLQSVHLLGITLANCLSPLNSLTSLQYLTPLYTIVPATMQRDFASLTVLTHLVLSATNFTGWKATAALALPALVSLHLRLIWDYDKVLAAPRLEALYLGWVDGLELDRLLGTLLPTVPASAPKFPRLRRLTAQGNIRVPMWKALMAALPGITHCTFLNKDIKNFLLALGDMSPGTAALLGRPWPALEVLALPNMLSAFEVRLMLAVQERRLAGCAVGVVLLPRSLALSAEGAGGRVWCAGVRPRDRYGQVLMPETPLSMHPTELTHAKSSDDRVWPITLLNLPNELLEAIFWAGYEQQHLELWPKEIPFEILVSHISHHCRIVVHNIARFWTSIDADTDVLWSSDIAFGYLKRSKDLLVDVFVRMHTRYRQPQRINILTLLDILCPHCERWRTLRVESSSKKYIETFVGGLQDGATRLQALDIRHFGHRGHHITWQPQIAFRDGLPSLRSFHLVGVDICYLDMESPPITSLHLHRYLTHALYSLRTNANRSFAFLTHIILSESGGEYWGDFGDGSFYFPSLKALYMRHSPDCIRFLAELVAPQLDTLYLESIIEEEMVDIATASIDTGSGTPKFSSIRHLILRVGAYFPELSASVWRLFEDSYPDTTHVSILDDDVGEFLGSLVGQGESTAPWMKLSTLSLPNAPKDLIADTVNKRAEIGFPIRNLQVSQAVYDDASSFFNMAKLVVEVAEDPIASFPAICHTEDWQDPDESDSEESGYDYTREESDDDESEVTDDSEDDDDSEDGDESDSYVGSESVEMSEDAEVSEDAGESSEAEGSENTDDSEVTETSEDAEEPGDAEASEDDVNESDGGEVSEDMQEQHVSDGSAQ
ncbi:hypothetical protein HWV62_15879 [Athelia sp. TMB]|nr:hypothetical protein HWV62_15879 [Athelia sp. TMB]